MTTGPADQEAAGGAARRGVTTPADALPGVALQIARGTSGPVVRRTPGGCPGAHPERLRFSAQAAQARTPNIRICRFPSSREGDPFRRDRERVGSPRGDGLGSHERDPRCRRAILPSCRSSRRSTTTSQRCPLNRGRWWRRSNDGCCWWRPVNIRVIRYDMPTLQVDGVSLVHVAAWKQHVSLYPVPPAGDSDLDADLAPVRRSEGHAQAAVPPGRLRTDRAGRAPTARDSPVS